MKNILLLLFMPFFLACQESYNFKKLPEGPINHHLIVVARTEEGIKARGFSKALPANTAIFFNVDKEHKKLTANADGSFMFEMPLKDSHAAFGEFTFDVDGKIFQQVYELKDLNASLAAVAQPAFSMLGDVSDISITPTHALILSSAAAQISKIKIDESFILASKNSETILLNPDPQTALFPRALSASGDHALVSLMGTDELALVGLTNGSVLSKSRLKNSDGSLFLFDLLPPLNVKYPMSADGLSPPSTTINRSFAHNPDQVLALGGDIFIASFVNYFQFADKSAGTDSVVGPGVVALLAIENKQIITKSIIVLPFKNPLFFTPQGDDTLWVICSGAFKEIGDKLTSVDAGIALLAFSHDKKTLGLKHQITLKDFVPGKPALVNDKLILPEAYGKRIAILDESSTGVREIKELTFRHPVGFIFATHWHDDVVFLGEERGTLVAFSLREGFFPFPFKEPIALDPKQDKSVIFAPHKMLFRPDELSTKNGYKPGFSGWVLSQLQNKIVPLDLLKVFGP